jgi:lipopolysaccharide export system permease protein
MLMAVASFFVTNNLVPYSNRKVFALMNDVREQKQKITFKDGQFFNGVDNMSIRVERQDASTGLLRGMLIYDTSGPGGAMTVTAADSGYIRLSDDRRFLDVQLFGGENYRFTRGSEWYGDNSLQSTLFAEQHSFERTPGFEFNRSDDALWGNSATTKNVVQLGADVDSLNREVNRMTVSTYRPLLYSHLFVRDTMVLTHTPEARRSLDERRAAALMDSIALMSDADRERLWNNAQVSAANSVGEVAMDETQAKSVLNQLYSSQVEWHKKWSLPVAVIVFFLIGAPLGAIIRKGGLGMPIVVSVSFFVLYYVISISVEKMAKEGTWPAFWGGWMPTMVLLPVALYLTYKATNDSGLLNTEWYIIQYQKLKKRYGKGAKQH